MIDSVNDKNKKHNESDSERDLMYDLYDDKKSMAGKEKPESSNSLLKLLSNKTFLKVMLCIFICIFSVSVVYLINIYDMYLNQRRIEQQVGDMFDAAKSQEPTATPPTVVASSIDDTAPQEPATESERDIERRMLLEAEQRGREMYADILDINPDFLGMIEIPGVISRQPYVMSHDNEEYLNTDFNGKRSNTGTIFLNMYNDRLLLDNNSVFFGHYSDTGSMFARLLSFKDAAVFKSSPVIKLESLIGDSTWVIFAAHVVEPSPWWMIPYNDDDTYSEHLREIAARSFFNTDVEVMPDDRIITLSVCDYTYEDMRFIVHARLLRPGEEAPASVVAVKNEDRKDYTIPHLNAVVDLEMKGATVAINPSNNKLFYFVPRAGYIERYSGDGREVQGPFSVYEGSGIAESSFISAGIIRTSDESSRAAYVAVQGLAGRSGISLLTAGTPTGTLRFDGVITPDGVNARYPTIQIIDGVLCLLYSVPGDNTSVIYKQSIYGGEQERVLTVQDTTAAHPLGVFTIDGKTIVVWHDKTGGSIDAARKGSSSVTNLRSASSGAKVTIYSGAAGSSVRCIIERNGSLTFTSLNLSEVLS